ncbi:MAG: lytic transglycosylase [Clostridiales bacterium GWD2_32_59]|nr:MAG: lytic transglycosylase [Clostridiales bacterium GWD2_32_59]
MKKLKKLFKLIIILFILISICINILYFLYPNKYKEQVLKYANEYEIEPYLIFAIIKTESNFNNDARSHKDALGLMQIRDTTGEWLAKRLFIRDYTTLKLHDPDINIMMGSWYIKSMMTKYNDLDTALASYNAGGGNMDKWLQDERYSEDGLTIKNIPFPETKKYVEKVKINKIIYQILY